MRLSKKIPSPKGVLRPAVVSWALLFLALVGQPSRTLAQEEDISELDVKAAFLYNFVKFVEWPAKAFESDSAPLTVMVFGDDEFAAKLATLLKDKKAHGRSLTVKRAAAVPEAREADVLFVSARDSRRTAQIVETLKNEPVLTIGESPQFFENGGMINLFTEDNQLRFEINISAAERTGLDIRSQLLRLAKSVKRE